jgi:transposase InsO family protein
MTYISIKKLHKLQISNLPSSEAGLEQMAKNKGWKFRVRNRVKEYLLPEQIASLIPVRVEPIPSILSARRDRTSKLGICEKYKEYCIKHELNYGSIPSIWQFCNDWAKGKIISPIAQIISKFSVSTLLRWLKNSQTPELLDGNYKGRLPIIDNQPEYQELIISLIHHRPSAIYREFKLRYAELAIPSEATIRRWIEKWAVENPVAYSIRTKGKDATRSKFLPAFGNHSDGLTIPCERVEIDCTKFELLLNVGGKKMRYQVMGAIDVYTRRKIFRLVPSANKHTVVRGLMNDVYSKWGMVQEIRTDNGSEFKNAYFQSTLATIGTFIHFCNPGCPQEKPHIERAFGALKTMLAERLPGFVGKDAVERKYQADRLEELTRLDLLLTPEQVQAHLDAYCRVEDERVRKDGLSPIHKYSELAGEVKRILPHHLEQLLFEPLGTRKVGKEGIKVNGLTYICDTLGEHMGKTVNIKAPDDAGYIDVYSLDNVFLCRAEYPELTGKSRVEIAIKTRAVYNTHLSRVKKEAKEAEAEADLKAYKEQETKVAPLVIYSNNIDTPATREIDKNNQIQLQLAEDKIPEVVSPEQQKKRLSVVEDLIKKPEFVRDGKHFSKLCQTLLRLRNNLISKEDAEWMIEMTEVKKFAVYIAMKFVNFPKGYPENLYISAGVRELARC